MCTYSVRGYEDRADYLDNLADEHDVDREIVWSLADLLGPDEDFDGLVTMIKDIGEGYM